MGNLTGFNSDELCCKICKDKNGIITNDQFLSREDNKDMVNNYLNEIKNDNQRKMPENKNSFDKCSLNSNIKKGLKKINRQKCDNMKVIQSYNNDPEISSELYTLSNDRDNEDDSESFLNDNNDNNNKSNSEINKNESNANFNNSSLDKNKSKHSNNKKHLYNQLCDKEKFDKNDILFIEQLPYYKRLSKSKESGKSIISNKVKDIILLKTYFNKIFRTGIEHMSGEVKLFLVITKEKILIYKDEMQFNNFHKPLESIYIRFINFINIKRKDKRKQLTIDYYKTSVDKSKRKFLEFELFDEENVENSNFEIFISLMLFITSNLEAN